MKMNVPNRRVSSLCYQFVSSESYDSNFGWFVSRRDRSDSAAHAKHYAKLENEVLKLFQSIYNQEKY